MSFDIIYYGKIIKWEKEHDKIGINYKVDLENWASIFKTIRLRRLNVIVECEDPGNYSFDLGPIIKVTKTSVYIQFIDPKGILDKDLTKVNFNRITKVMFDDRYINVLSKYIQFK